MKKIGIIDTMFARINMGKVAIEELEIQSGFGSEFVIIRKTVPGFKDLAVAAKILLENDGCDIALAFGMPGAAKLDENCAHEASMAIAMAQLMTNKHILEVFVHEIEGQGDDNRLKEICLDRCKKHSINAYNMIFNQEELIKNAGLGRRQGSEHKGPIQ